MIKKKVGFLILSCSVIGLGFSVIGQVMQPSKNVSAMGSSARSRIENSPSITTNRIVNMPDVNLRKVINQKYLKQSASAPITVRQLQSLRGTLYLGASGIKDITGLEHCKGVTRIYLSHNEIRDISPLKNLTRLTMLNITNQKINEKDVIAKDKIAVVNNVVKGMDGENVAPIKNNQYTYNPVNNNITFQNITKTGKKSYSFRKRVYFGKYSTYFSGDVTQNIITK